MMDRFCQLWILMISLEERFWKKVEEDDESGAREDFQN